MLALAAAPDGAPILVGKLSMTRSGRLRRPTLQLTFWSPSDHEHRTVVAPDCYRPDGLIPVELGHPLDGLTTVSAMADPALERESLDVIAAHASSVRRWRKEQEFAGRLADRRVLGGPSDQPLRRPWLTPG